VIKELKEEKAELCRKNEELRESNTDMRQTILQLNQANNQLEDEKSSLMTIVKIIQHDSNQQHTEAKASSNITSGNDENVRSPPILIQNDARPETSNQFQVFDADLNSSAGSVSGTLANALITENRAFVLQMFGVVFYITANNNKRTSL
jgi:hypothetical protein